MRLRWPGLYSAADACLPPLTMRLQVVGLRISSCGPASFEAGSRLSHSVWNGHGKTAGKPDSPVWRYPVCAVALSLRAQADGSTSWMMCRDFARKAAPRGKSRLGDWGQFRFAPDQAQVSPMYCTLVIEPVAGGGISPAAGPPSPSSHPGRLHASLSLSIAAWAVRLANHQPFAGGWRSRVIVLRSGSSSSITWPAR